MQAIWANMFTLPPGIQTICIIQFFNLYVFTLAANSTYPMRGGSWNMKLTTSLAWFPILFFTSVWVSEIYKSSVPMGDLDEKTYTADAVRSGNRALFLQAIVTIIVGIGAPFLVSGNGIQQDMAQGGTYSALGGQGQYTAGWHVPRSIPEAVGLGREVYERARAGTLFSVPIKGLTLVKLWSMSMAVFAFAMACTW